MPRARLTLTRVIGLRPLARHPGRALLTLLGVAAGVGVYVGIDLAAKSSIQSFSQTARAVAGPAVFRIHHRPLALPESLLVALRPLQSRASFHPVLETGARAHTADGYAFSILGIDLLGDPRFRDVTLLSSGASPARPRAAAVRGFFDPGLLLVPAPLDRAIAGQEGASRRGVATLPSGRTGAVTESLTVVVGTRAHRFRVQLLELHGPVGSAAGTVAFMDIAPFQERFGRVGELDWIDVEPAPGEDREVLRRDLETAARRVAADIRVEPPEARAVQMERMLASYRRNLRALSLISLVVGMLLAYNALLSSVLQRRDEIALLRALGAPRRTVALLIGVEGLAIGLAGGAVGVLLGRALSEGALRLVSRTVGELYARATAAPVSLTPEHWILGVGLGVASAGIASLGPIREALRVRPLEFLREEHLGQPDAADVRVPVLGAIASAALAFYLIAHPEGRAAGYRGYLGATAALLAGALLARPAFTGAVRLLRGPLRRVWSPAGRIAYATALAARRRLAVSVAALLLAYSIVWGMASLVESFRVTVDRWAVSTLRADLWVTPQSRAGSPAEGTLPPSWRARLAALPEVGDVDAFRVREMPMDGDLCFLGADETRVIARRGFLPLVGGGSAASALERASTGRYVLVSEPLARRKRLRPGSTLALDTPTGRHEYSVLAVYRDYSSDRGYVIVDRGVYIADFGDSLVSTYALFLKPGVPRAAAALAVSRALGPGELIRVTDTRTIREEVHRVMRNTFAVTDALEVIAAAVALLSVLGTLAALVIERRREIGVLRAVGASGLQVAQALLLEGALLAGVGLALGALTGSLLSAVLVHVLNRESFGWTLEVATPWNRTAVLAGVLFVAALLAALPPARRAASVPPREAMNRA
jgi:putative ABC transport system permease protein